MDVLHDRAHAGVKLLICLGMPDSPEAQRALNRVHDTLAPRNQRGQTSYVEIRLHHITLNNSIYRADNEFIVGQHVSGVPADVAPALHLLGDGNTQLVATYLESFDRVWADSRRVA